ncbi:cytochrome-c oxidase, cbb3-type subunit III [Psychrosphaera ytuae]|uniref:Cbb3-type cytochrome c oxidase subunit n=1 Tax=Psychrosphaera ytuae TaxID=2820710 RepID=A0A975HJF3_9GAMM|nr:cytochrome-c oxidase, cbb3-type subunit III [Psychrosphaera ytuae]QTH65251.1 cytochrome-c oxidase, cbb3-type subunit III [Psychrosphaera ytuae]
MTSFWSWWVIILTVFSIVACFWIITVNLKNYTHVGEGESMGHEFDGIEELNNPLPKWWTYTFYLILVWSVGYLAAMPGLGNWEGFLGWKSSNQGITTLAESKRLSEKAKAEGLLVQLDQEVKRADETFGPVFKALAEKPLMDLAYDEEGFKVGQRLYLQNCALCHGSDARGSEGFPNLRDNDWLYGGEPETIVETLLYGRKAQMPGWEAALGEQGIQEMTEYVLRLAGRKVNDKLADAGQAKFAMCAACHGPDGKGSLAHNLPFGAPNLTDNIWLYGGSRKAVEETLRYGRNGVMPAWKDVLGEDKVRVISAYIYNISHPDK